MLPEHQPVIRFGPYSLDEARGLLERAGEPVRLRPKTFALLCYLARNADRVISRDEIIERIWGGLAITDDAITQTVRDIRRTLSDVPELVTSLPKRGYVFSTLRLQSAVAPDEVPETPETAAPASQIPTLLRWPSIAVLPFTTSTADPGLHDILDGLVNDITASLAGNPSLRVIARGTMRSYRDRATNLQAIAAELGVRYVLDGNARQAGGRLRVSVHLVEGATATQIWAANFEGDAGDVFALQDSICEGVVAALESCVRLAEIERARRKPPEAADAYDLFVLAVPLVYRNTPSEGGRAVALLERSLALDPLNAPAHAYKAWCHQQLYFRGGFRQEDYEAALHHADQALELGPDDVQSLGIAGFVHGFMRSDFASAIAILDRALAIKSNSALALRFSALMNAFSYRHERAEADAMKALRLSPLDPMNYHVHVALGFAYLTTRRYEEAGEQARLSLQMNPGFTPMYAFLILALDRQGRREEVDHVVDQLSNVAPGFTTSGLLRMGFLRPLREEFEDALGRAGLPP